MQPGGPQPDDSGCEDAQRCVARNRFPSLTPTRLDAFLIRPAIRAHAVPAAANLETLTGVRPLPHWDFVTQYLTAYYLSEKELLKWVQQHPEYQLAHFLSIARTGVAMRTLKRKDLKSFETNVEAL